MCLASQATQLIWTVIPKVGVGTPQEVARYCPEGPDKTSKHKKKKNIECDYCMKKSYIHILRVNVKVFKLL